jgi:urease accessory protein
MFEEAKALGESDCSTAGWKAYLGLEFEARSAKTVLARRQHHGPLVVQRPFYPEQGVCHVYLLHPPGGVVSGDCLQIDIKAAPHAQVLLTTPAAGKFYRSSGKPTHQSVQLNIAEEAALEWLPQEAIVYEGAQFDSAMTVTLAPGGRFLGWEILVLGRPAAEEGFNLGSANLSWHIVRDNQVLLMERLHLDAEAFSAPWGLAGHSSCGTMIAIPADRAALETVQQLIGDQAGRGVTLIGDMLICRALDARADRLREFFEQVWTALRPWVVNRQACAPRIWAT